MTDYAPGFTATGARVHLVDVRVLHGGIAACGTHVMVGSERVTWAAATCQRCRKAALA